MTSQTDKEVNALEYSVTWTIDLDAESPEDAARKALEIHRDPESIATHFIVRDEHDTEQEIWVTPPEETNP
jgi:hypothetical protein